MPDVAIRIFRKRIPTPAAQARNDVKFKVRNDNKKSIFIINIWAWCGTFHANPGHLSADP